MRRRRRRIRSCRARKRFVTSSASLGSGTRWVGEGGLAVAVAFRLAYKREAPTFFTILSCDGIMAGWMVATPHSPRVDLNSTAYYM